MCEHCDKSRMWGESLGEGQNDVCDWTTLDVEGKERETATDCDKKATRKVHHRYVLGHLCEMHMLKAMKEEHSGDDELDTSKSDFVPIEEAHHNHRCGTIVRLPPLSLSGEMKDADYLNDIGRCGLPATHAQVMVVERSFCEEHLKIVFAQEVQHDIDKLPGKFVYEKKPFIKSEERGVMCARKGCGKIAYRNIDNLPEGWRVIVIARGSLLQQKNLLNADRDGVLCPEHFKEMNSLLLDLPFKAF
jgi:hypothetical protein